MVLFRNAVELNNRGLDVPFSERRLRKDQNFYLEMSYCFEHGIPHSKFLKWDAEDRAKTLAFAMELSARCTMCGTASWEWEENKFAFTAVDEFCQGCYQKAMFSEAAELVTAGHQCQTGPDHADPEGKDAVSARKRARIGREGTRPSMAQDIQTNVVLTADNSQYDQAMMQSAGSTDNLGKSVDSLGTKIDKLTKSAGRN